MICNHCKNSCIKKGYQKNGTQKYQCCACNKYQQLEYQRKAWSPDMDKRIIRANRECCGIRSIARLLEIAPKTVIARIKKLADVICFPKIFKQDLEYEADEIKTFVGNKENEMWVCYAIRRDTREPVVLKVGKRNKTNISFITQTLEQFSPRRVYTDGLEIYKSLLDKTFHRVRPYFMNKIERKNLTLRTHIKRLVRKGICFSRKVSMLEACVKLYFWG